LFGFQARKTNTDSGTARHRAWGLREQDFCLR
jgi:hypothetical protein